MKTALIALAVVALLGVAITVIQSMGKDSEPVPVLHADDVAARLHDLGFPDAKFAVGPGSFDVVQTTGTRDRCDYLEGELRKLTASDCIVVRCGSVASRDWLTELVRYDGSWYALGTRRFPACQ